MDNTIKFKIKKILLFLSILPYLILLVMGIFNLCQDIVETGHLDLYCLVEPLANFWFEIIIDLNIFYIFLIIFCIVYPIYYLLDKPSKKKDKELKVPPKIKKNDKLFVLYMISLLPYLLLIYFSIFGIEISFFDDTTIYYGFEAILIVLLVGSIIPIYPIILIYQIIFTIKKHKFFSNIQKKIVLRTIIILLLLLIIPSIIYLFF